MDLSQSPHDPHGSQGHTVRYCSHHSPLTQSTSNTNVYALIAMHPSPSCLCWKSQSFTKACGHCHDIAPLPKQRAARRLLAVQDGEAFARYAASPISNVLAGRSWLGHLISSCNLPSERDWQKPNHPSNFANEPGRVLAGIAGPGKKEPFDLGLL